jgi:MFS family permease
MGKDRRTYFFDSLRRFFQGALDSAFLTVTHLLAIRIFQAPSWMKSVLSSLSWAGGMTAPLITRLAVRTGWPASCLGACLFSLIGCCFLGAAIGGGFRIFLLLIGLASIFYRAEGPILIGMYVENYSAGKRASRLALGLTLAALMSIVFGQGSGIILDWNIHFYRPLLAAIALCSFLCAICLLPIHTSPLCKAQQTENSGYFSMLIRDKKFLRLVIYFSMVGLAYQMLIPMKMEYLANDRYGLCLNNLTVMAIAWVVPNIARVLSTQIIGILFDKFRLIPVRIASNLFTFFAFVIIFHSRSIGVLLLGATLQGIAMAASFVLHGLWISKVTEKERMSAYMSLYQVATGVRSVVAPLLGYVMLSVLTPTGVANLACLLILFSTLGFWRMRRLEGIR